MFVVTKKMELRDSKMHTNELNIIRERIKNSIVKKANIEHIDISFRKYEKGKDEKILANMLNSFFAYGKVLSENDIFNDFNKKDTIDDLALFLCISDTPIGFGQIIKTNKGFSLVNVGIIEKYRNLGFGKLLVANIVYTAINLGMNDFHLYISLKNKNAEKLYTSLGFVFTAYDIQYIENQFIKKIIHRLLK